MYKIAITGPESTGKTTLAAILAEHFSGKMIPEFARQFLANKSSYTLQDLHEIAVGQWTSEEKAIQEGNELLICDSDPLVFGVWSLEKFNNLAPSLEQKLIHYDYDMTLFCMPDLPWVYDPLRENEHNRNELAVLYEKIAKKYNISLHRINGFGDFRTSKAIAILEKFLNKK